MRGHAFAHAADTPLEIPRAPSRWGALAGDFLTLLMVVLSIPFVILAVGLPIALIVQLLLWIARLF